MYIDGEGATLQGCEHIPARTPGGLSATETSGTTLPVGIRSCVIFDADVDAKDLYVAMTRGSKSSPSLGLTGIFQQVVVGKTQVKVL
jgi:hypothetical protein